MRGSESTHHLNALIFPSKRHVSSCHFQIVILHPLPNGLLIYRQILLPLSLSLAFYTFSMDLRMIRQASPMGRRIIDLIQLGLGLYCRLGEKFAMLLVVMVGQRHIAR